VNVIEQNYIKHSVANFVSVDPA